VVCPTFLVKVDFLDTIYDCPFEMHELVTDKKNTKERLQNAIMDFVTGYGLLGFMTALTTTPDFITYHAVYLPKNHFIKEESMTTEKYLSRPCRRSSLLPAV